MKIPNGPSSSGLVHQLKFIQWILNPFAVMDERAKLYGDVFVISKNKRPLMVYLSRPEAIEQILTADPDIFEVGSANAVLLPLLGENSLVLLNGIKHQRQRRLLMPPFHGDRLRLYGQIICDITQRVISGWHGTFAVRASMQEISLRVILSTVFGIDEGQRYDQIRKKLSLLLESVGSPLSSLLLFFPALQKDWGAWSPWGRFCRLKQEIDHLLMAEIQSRREGDPDQNDILSLLLQARDEAGQPMTDQELRDELLTLLFAGHETTASALAWALYWIDRLPEVKDKLLRELSTLPADADPLAISRLPYLNAVCSETLRIYPIAPNTFPRIARKSIEVAGYQFEPGTIFMLSIYLTHHREEIYPDPKRFKPERFLERQFSPFEYFPFGGSNRRCIGAAFALFEMKLVLATVLSRCELKLASDRPVKPTRRGLTVAPPTNMCMVVNFINHRDTENAEKTES